MIKQGKKYQLLAATGKLDAKGKPEITVSVEVLCLKVSDRENTHELAVNGIPMTEAAPQVLPSAD